ncbi:amidase [Agrobacterium tumefaciens]|uniref:amidase n=1 Tax=Agrobacterium tumefaciens TaxID=358 RepID=UPI0015735AA2|nr:amidase [Agrobacterium tumefaciens]
MTDICDLTASELLPLYAARQLSPVEVTRAVLKRADEIQGELNAFCHIDEEGALVQARKSEKAWMTGGNIGALEGIPVSIKDVVAVKGWQLGRGSLLSDRNPPSSADAPSAARLRNAGSVIFASTTTCEGGWKAVTDSRRTGITRNPYDPSLSPGGSSGGAAAAVASGAGPLALGTDGGGSVRIPASFTGIFGLKPQYGRVPQFPLGPHYGNLSHQGPMTRSVKDAAAMLKVLNGTHTLDPDTIPAIGHSRYDELFNGVAGIRVAVTKDFGFMPTDPAIGQLVEEVADVLRERGAIVDDLPSFDDWRPAYRSIWSAGAHQALRRLSPEDRALVDEGFVAVANQGAKVTLEEYLDAQMHRVSLRAAMNRAYDAFDVILSPSVAILPFVAGVTVPDERFSDWLDWAGLSLAFNLTGQPAASVPIGFVNGLPVGGQIVGRVFDDVGVLRVAAAIEASIDGRRAPSALANGVAKNKEVV